MARKADDAAKALQDWLKSGGKFSPDGEGGLSNEWLNVGNYEISPNQDYMGSAHRRSPAATFFDLTQ
jgi:hypothetical protein